MLWIYNLYLTLVAISAGAAGIVSIQLFRKKDTATSLLAFVFLVIALEATRTAIMQGMFGFSSRVPFAYIWFALAVRTLKTIAMACFALQLQGVLKIGGQGPSGESPDASIGQ